VVFIVILGRFAFSPETHASDQKSVEMADA
jgi:hypothetical protein